MTSNMMWVVFSLYACLLWQVGMLTDAAVQGGREVGVAVLPSLTGTVEALFILTHELGGVS